MSLPELNLDDRTFEDIVAEAKRRIPGYTSEWTDLNDSDPGMALVHLFAWMSEMIIYRLNKVPEKNYRKFLELAGIKLEPAKASRADITFFLSEGAPTNRAITIPQGTRVALSDSVNGPPVVFETDADLEAVAARIVKWRSVAPGEAEVIERGPDFENQIFLPFGPDAQTGHAFEIAFDRALPAKTEIKLTVGVAEPDKGEESNVLAEATPVESDSESGEFSQSTELPRRNAPVELSWFWRLDSEANWIPLPEVKDITAGFQRSATISFTAPSLDNLKTSKPDKDKPFLWIRCQIQGTIDNGYETPPRIERVLLNTVSAQHAAHVLEEMLGSASGLPNQVFKLISSPVIPGTVKVLVRENDLGELKWREWKQVSHFTKSGRTDRVFTLNYATGEIRFGDGRHGMIPPMDPLPNGVGLYENVKASYRWGGGAQGNAGPDKITGLQSAAAYVEKATNHAPAVGGADAQSVKEAIEAAPDLIRSRSRAVTASDFEALAKATPGAFIRRAKALSNHMPGFEHVSIPGVVTVIVVPAVHAGQDKATPSRETLELVGKYLNRHRLVTTQVYVKEPRYRHVRVVAEVTIEKNANTAEVRKALEKRMKDYFHPITGSGGKGWEFGGTIRFTNVVREIFKVEGVKDIATEDVDIYVDEERREGDILLTANDLTYSTDHWFTVKYQ